jgi:hypothetical protein
MVAADALLKGSKADVKNLNGVYTAIDSASKAAGTYVTDAMYKGGVNAAADSSRASSRRRRPSRPRC